MKLPLFYFGMTTLDGRDAHGNLLLRIPNLVTRGLYFEQLRQLLLPNEFEQILWQEVSAADDHP